MADTPSNEPSSPSSDSTAKLRMRAFRRRRRAALVELLELFCENCSQPFDADRYLGERRRFCSRKCKELAAARRRRHRHQQALSRGKS